MVNLIAKFLRSGVTSVLVFALWLFSMFLVNKSNSTKLQSADLSQIPLNKTSLNEYQNWMDIYMGQNKIGYAMQSLVNSPLGFVMKEYSLINLPMGGTVREIYLDSYAVLNLDYSLKNFTFGLISGDYTTDIFGDVKDGQLKIKYKSQASESQQVFELEGPIYLPSAAPLLAHARDFSEWEFFLSTFDPFSLAVSSLQIVIGPAQEVETNLGVSRGNRLSLIFSGLTTTMWVDRAGRILLEEETGGMKMTATDRESALNMPVVEINGLDILDALAVQSDKPIPDARTLKTLKVRLDGIEGAFFDLADDFQHIISNNPLIIEIKPFERETSLLADSSRYLKPEQLLQVDDHRIVEAAKKIIGDETDPERRAGLIFDWVYKNVQKDFTVSLPSAVDVLKTLKGDCNEHTALFTALSRAAGLPTKVCIGIVYKDGIFYYHAWPAVYLGGWRSMDPTFGQAVSDASHIKLLEGGFERQADLMRVVGKLSVTILEYSSDINL